MKAPLAPLGTILLSSLMLSACSVQPTPLASDELVTLAETDQHAMFADQAPLTGPLSLDEAMARAVKYNLEHRLALMEGALQNGLRDVKSLDMLPKLAASSGWQWRDNPLASSSESLLSGQESLEPSTSQEKSYAQADLRLSWSVLDFGVGYFAAQSQANQQLAAEERRRQVVADIIQQVRSAWWRAAVAEHLKPRVETALAQARHALEQAEETQRLRLRDPLETLHYRKQLVEMVRQLEAVDAELGVAKARLAGLINLPPGSDLDLPTIDMAALQAPTPPYDLATLERMAMVQQPELREQSYLARNAVLETRRDLIRLLPGASLFIGSNYNSNDYLVNNHWADAGVQVSWNLLNVLAWPKVSELGDTREAVAELRRRALRMALITRLNVAWQQYHQARRIYANSAELADLQQQILDYTENALQSNAASPLEEVTASTEMVLAMRSRGLGFAELQSALGAIQQAAGLDPLPETLADTSLDDLTKAIAATRRARHASAGAVASDLPRLNSASAASMPRPANAATHTATSQPTASLSNPSRTPAPVNPPTPARLQPWQSLNSLRDIAVEPFDGQP